MNFSFSFGRALVTVVVVLFLFTTLVEGSGYGLARRQHTGADVLKRHSTHIHVQHKGLAAAPHTTSKKRKPLKRKLPVPPTVAKRDDTDDDTCTVSSDAASSTVGTTAASQTPASNSGNVPQNVATGGASSLRSMSPFLTVVLSLAAVIMSFTL